MNKLSALVLARFEEVAREVRDLDRVLGPWSAVDILGEYERAAVEVRALLEAPFCSGAPIVDGGLRDSSPALSDLAAYLALPPESPYTVGEYVRTKDGRLARVEEVRFGDGTVPSLFVRFEDAHPGFETDLLRDEDVAARGSAALGDEATR